MGNVIAKYSEMYERLISTYETTNAKERFYKCYSIVDEADYKEIHLVISMLKRDASVNIDNVESFSNIMQLFKAIIQSLSGKIQMRKSFLLDILEEARERKRPQCFSLE